MVLFKNNWNRTDIVDTGQKILSITGILVRIIWFIEIITFVFTSPNKSKKNNMIFLSDSKSLITVFEIVIVDSEVDIIKMNGILQFDKVFVVFQYRQVV